MSPQEQLLVELSQWLGRTLQYSAAHPVCAQLAGQTHGVLQRALAVESPVTFAVTKDDVMIGETPAKHAAVKRLAPYLHERGVLLLRFTGGATVDELTSFVAMLTLQPQSVFDRGGMSTLARERAVTHVQIEEIAHDITSEEREAATRRKKLRSFFKEKLQYIRARREGISALADHLAEMLEHPDVAVAILEEDANGVAEAAAGLALMVRQQEERTGETLAPKLHDVLLLLSPPARDRTLLGLPSLIGEFRQALVWAMDGLGPNELARFFFPSLRARATDLDATLYAVSAAVMHEGTRLSALRRAGLGFFDLQAEDTTATEALAALAAPVPEHGSFRRERECLQEPAATAFALRLEEPPVALSDVAIPPFDGRRAITEVLQIATRTRGFGKLCAKLPQTAAAFAASGATEEALGAILALEAVRSPEWRDVARDAAREVARASASAVLARLDARSASASARDLDEMGAVVRVLAEHAPAAVLDRLDVSESRKMRRLMLDLLPALGPELLPLLAPRLRSTSWFVVRNAVLLVGRCRGTVSDLAGVSGHANKHVRLELVRALRAMPPDEATMDVAVAHLVDESHEVEVGARGLLRGELLGAHAVARVHALLVDEARPEDLRRALIDVLGRCPRDDAAAALWAVMQPLHMLDLGSMAALRDAAAVALRASPAPRGAVLFAEGMASAVKRVRKSCERAAGTGG